MDETDKKNVTRVFNPHSGKAFFMQFYYSGNLLATGTGFFVAREKGAVLVTNRHNLTGRHNYTGEPLHTSCGIPNHAVIYLPTAIGRIAYCLDLYADESWDTPLWVEHPTLGSRADIAGLLIPELKDTNTLASHAYITLGEHWHRRDIGTRLHVIGYPYGMLCGIFPVWSNGYIASEPDFDFADLPIFLVDCRSRPGQSGSPVIGRSLPGDIVKKDGELYQAKNETYDFHGIYSGRIRSDSDLGIVWKEIAVEELVQHVDAVGPAHIMESRNLDYEINEPAEIVLDTLYSRDSNEFK